MLGEHDRIVLTEDISAGRLKAGDVGTIVHVHRDGKAFEVEFLALDGIRRQSRPCRPRGFVP